MNPDRTAAFAVLGLEPRPGQDANTVRLAYQQRARSLHPDADDGDAERFRELGTAYALVRSAASRLRLLAAVPVKESPPITDADLFMQIGAALQTGSRQPASPTNPLERALRQVETQKALENWKALRHDVTTRLAACEAELSEFDARWPDVAAAELLALAARFERLESWKRQIDEASLALQ